MLCRDSPWNSTAYVRNGWIKDGAARSSGFLQSPTTFHMIGSSCTSERRAKCPALSGHPAGATCNNLRCVFYN